MVMIRKEHMSLQTAAWVIKSVSNSKLVSWSDRSEEYASWSVRSRCCWSNRTTCNMIVWWPRNGQEMQGIHLGLVLTWWHWCWRARSLEKAQNTSQNRTPLKSWSREEKTGTIKMEDDLWISFRLCCNYSIFALFRNQIGYRQFTVKSFMNWAMLSMKYRGNFNGRVKPENLDINNKNLIFHNLYQAQNSF